MSEMKPDPQVRQILLKALVDAFKTRVAIAQLTDFALAKPLDYFNSDGSNTISLIRAVVGECEAQGGNTLQLLLEVALELRPHHHDLHQIALQFGVKSSGAKPARRPTRLSSAAERAESEIATRQLLNKYPEIESFDTQIWQEILTPLDPEFSIVSTAGRTDKRKFGKLIEEMMRQNRLQELERWIQKAAKLKLEEERERNKIITQFNNAYDQANWDKVLSLSGTLERLNAHNQATRNRTAQAYKTRGTRHLDNRDYSSAIEAFRQAINYSRSRSVQASCYYLRGQAYVAQEEYNRALDDFEQALERDVSKTSYYCWQARCYQVLKEFDKAIEIYDRIIAVEPQNAEYYYWRGICHYETQNSDLAIRDFKLATTTNHRHVDAWYGLGLVYYFWKNSHREAEYYFGQAANLGHSVALRYYLDIRRKRGII